MSALEALEVARAAGLALFVDGNGLIVEGSVPPPDAVVDLLRRHKTDLIALLTGGSPAWTPEDWQAFFDERAGRLEFDEHVAREEAEAMAYRTCVIEWLRQHPVHAPAGRCASCGGSETNGAPVVPLAISPTPRDWLHPSCWPEWNAHRELEATAALAELGLNPPVNGQRQPSDEFAVGVA